MTAILRVQVSRQSLQGHCPPLKRLACLCRASRPHVRTRPTAVAFASLIFAMLLASLLPAMAQTWPNARPIRIVVPFPAGGAVDVTARLVGDSLSRELNQSVIVENIGGAGGNVGAATVAKSDGDGYTILISGDPIASAPHVSKASFDPLKDFSPIIQLTRQPIVFAAHPSLGVKTFGELVSKVREQPGMPFATAGAGTSHHLLGEWLSKRAGMKLVHVPYRGGGAAINDLAAGHIKLGSLGATPILPYVKAGTLTAIAQSGAVRSQALPELPTLVELGFSDIVLEQWMAAFAPASTPPDIVARLNRAVDRALADPGLRQKLADQALDPVGGTPEALARQLAVDFEKYGRLVREAGLQAKN
ncbi:tripartite tricarboxylate transporter substrate binding protein [Rhabdaerophilum sp. SD176]|uniref:Bug family tripartite tricarboxylate transporter substrate binding protein n=1 Tax=Rhabdaerophilum sp. SD176 TaxID=2983548 RepID=UPI0024E03AE3|nr:tripartite tricarboxylate transporter substrate binding protein [Rhabdaerophilum sp. SD176]